jgi:hypothetical protein
MWRGLIVGILGAGLWLGGLLFTPLGTSRWFDINHCPPASVSPDCGLEPVIPILFGPPIGILVSVFLGWRVDRALAQRIEWGRRTTVFAFAVAVYGGALGVCWGLSLAPRYIGVLPVRLALLPLALSGLDWVGPLPIVLWALIGGAVHASLWRPRRLGAA